MSTLKTALSEVKAALNGNSAINSWCQENFGRIPKIFIGIDPKNPPEMEKNTPMICIGTGVRYREPAQAYIVHALDVACSIECNEIIVTGQVEEYTGINLVDEFALMVEKAVTKRFNSKGIPGTQEPSMTDSYQHPFYEAVWTYLIRSASRLS
ncbi:MAG: hypothetical protein HQM10_26525 [Candidatus Riflebacteria bacterium]|nr:hypothetical protein [Candidatus Riflebacteria bacterium]